MKPALHIRPWLKWGGLAVTILLLLVWNWNKLNVAAWNGDRHWLLLQHGGIELIYHDSDSLSRIPGFHAGRMQLPLVWMPKHQTQPYESVFFPFWPICAITLITTLIAWWPDFRALFRKRVGQCRKCHYDLTGLKPGSICPECGMASSRPG